MEQKKARGIFSSMLLCRHTGKRKEYLAKFGRFESNGQPPDTYSFQFFKDDMKKESCSFNFRKKDFCGIELTRVIQKSFYGLESNVIRLHVLFTKQNNIELEETKNTPSRYCDEIMHKWCRTLEMELGYHCHWTVYIRPHDELEWIEGYQHLHFTDDIISIVSMDKHPRTIHHWELTDVLSVKVGQGCLVMTYKNIKGALMFETNQAEDIQQKLVSKIPNLSLKLEQDVSRRATKCQPVQWKDLATYRCKPFPHYLEFDSPSNDMEPQSTTKSCVSPSEDQTRDSPLFPNPAFVDNSLTASSVPSIPSPFSTDSNPYKNHPLQPPDRPPNWLIPSETHSNRSSASGNLMNVNQTSPSDHQPADPSANQIATLCSEHSSSLAEQLGSADQSDEHEFVNSEISSGMDYEIDLNEYVNHEYIRSQIVPALPPKDIINECKSSPSSDCDYISTANICHTLITVTPPDPDTLGLGSNIRNEVCIHLYLNNYGSNWKGLADSIGLNYGAVQLIDAFSLRHQHEMAAEIVLRHWQFCYNRYGKDKEKCPQICNKDTFLDILENMHRQDIIDIIEPKVS